MSNFRTHLFIRRSQNLSMGEITVPLGIRTVLTLRISISITLIVD